MKFNEKLKHLRQAKGVTQEQLANDIFVSRTLISKYESGDALPSEESLIRIGDYFNEDLTCYSIKKIDKKARTKLILAIVGFSIVLLGLLLLVLPIFKEYLSIYSHLVKTGFIGVTVITLFFIILSVIMSTISFIKQKLLSSNLFLAILGNIDLITIVFLLVVLWIGIGSL